jgi:hypothetical protein
MTACRTSPVWKYFIVSSADLSRVSCKICNTSLSRGGKGVKNSYNTSNLRKHLESMHENEFRELRQVEDEKKTSASLPVSVSTSLQPVNSDQNRQLTIASAFDIKRPWEFDDERSRRIHRIIGEMIALDDQPFNIVNNEGFKRLVAALEPRYTLPSDKYLRTTLIPEMHRSLSEKMSIVLASARYISFTSDSWTTSQCTDSLLSITAHWITDSWERRAAVIAACPIDGSHTADNIAGIVKSLLRKWNIGSKVHVFLRDNAKNMTAGLRDAGVPSISCFSHTLQLCVKAGLVSQRAVIDATTTCRNVATHFSHSVLAKGKLEDIQKTVPDQPCHAIIQDVQTRWNSTFYMLNRLIEQKKPLILYAADNNVVLPSAHQWTLIERVVAILSPIERATRDVSAEASCLSDVIPLVVALKRALQNITDDNGVQTMKAEIVKEIDLRFGDVTKEPLHAIATLVDPRYRGKLFAPSELDDAVKRLTELTETIALPSVTPLLPSLATTTTSPVIESAAKRAKLDDRSPLDLLDADLQAGTVVCVERSAADEVADYLRQQNIQRQLCPLQWWKLHQKDYPRIAAIAMQYLSGPSTSVPSERLFSSAGDLYSDSRNRLSAHLAEMLLFIKNNFKFL